MKYDIIKLKLCTIKRKRIYKSIYKDEMRENLIHQLKNGSKNLME